jgi:capsular exopolysaccharide synthesis family protein
MSRFFDALREASRSGNVANGNQPGNPPPADIQEPPLEGWVGPVPEDPGVSSAPPIQPSPLAEPEIVAFEQNTAEAPSTKVLDRHDTGNGKGWDAVSEELFHSFGSFAPPQSDLSGTTAKVTLDRTARLIPNTLDPTVVEHYRRLRTKILQQQSTMPFRTVVVTSPNPQEGKSVTVMNLGLSLAMVPDYKVLIVDGDLRRGSLGRWLGVEDQPGLSNLVDGSASIENTVFKCEDRPLHFILRGTSEVPPAELLQSPQLSSVFRRLADAFDLVLIDTPPVNLITDAQLLAGACDAVLLIARAYATNRKGFEKAVQELRPFRLIGTVLNGGSRAKSGSRYKGYYNRKE